MSTLKQGGVWNQVSPWRFSYCERVSDVTFIQEKFFSNLTGLVGLILSFCYTAAKALKARACTKTTASFQHAMPLRVFNSWNKNGKFKNQQPKSNQSFMGIEKYRGTIPKPTYELRLNQNILNQLSLLV